MMSYKQPTRYTQSHYNNQKRYENRAEGYQARERRDMNRPREKSNLVMVSGKRPASFYIYLVKQLFLNEKYDMVELHGAGDRCINSAIKVVGVLVKYRYVTITRLKTKTLNGREGKVGKIIIHLAKTHDFEEIYKKFEEERAERYPRESTTDIHKNSTTHLEAKDD